MQLNRETLGNVYRRLGVASTGLVLSGMAAAQAAGGFDPATAIADFKTKAETTLGAAGTVIVGLAVIVGLVMIAKKMISKGH